MSEPEYAEEKYIDNPPIFKRWSHIYVFVLSQFAATLAVLHYFPCWF